MKLSLSIPFTGMIYFLFTSPTFALDPPTGGTCTTDYCSAKHTCEDYIEDYGDNQALFERIVSRSNNEYLLTNCFWPDGWVADAGDSLNFFKKPTRISMDENDKAQDVKTQKNDALSETKQKLDYAELLLNQ
ncbi:hypothetical protein [Kaarinaea lacus]